MIDAAIERFKNHEITTIVDTEHIKVYDFKSVQLGNYLSQRWIISGNTLTIIGDCYDSIYRWTNNLSLCFLAGCDLEYFSSKCCADKDGCKQKYYNDVIASYFLKGIAADNIYYMYENILNYSGDFHLLNNDDRFQVIVPVIESTFGIDVDEIEQLFSVETETDAINLLVNGKYDIMFGDEAYQYIDKLHIMTPTPLYHLAALKSAYKKYPNLF